MDNESTRHGILESILQDPSAKPRALRLQELKEATNNFSEDRQLGKGGFGIVYKGLLPNGEVVAVKDLISSQFEFQEKQFQRELDNLMKVQHKNIVRFLGYCYESSYQYTEYEATHVFAESPKMLLCFEYMPNGSLDNHINDESCGLDWHKCYRIIKGICHGLHYLHEECQPHGSVIHLDLKPENILLDDSMVPKIADFGISKFFSGQKLETRATSAIGSRGYMAPEYTSGNIVSKKADIYSLGVIIMQIIIGRRVDVTYCEHIVEPVLENWSKRMEAKTSVTDCEQIRICLQIGIQCMEFKKKNRPSIKEILEILNRSEDINNRYANDKETYKQELRETVREETAEEMVARVGGIMAPAALDAVRAAAGFPGPWEEIASTLEELRACLLNPSCHPCLANNKALCCEVLQSVADTVARATDIAGRCREPLTAGNKKLESAIRELPWQLDVSLWDCEVLVKVGELYYEDENNASSPPPLVDATSSSSCVDVRELQRLLAWMEISHTDGKNLALDGILEALHKDETRVVSMFDRDNVSALVSLLSALSPEAVREKAATVLSYVVASHDWLVESEDALRRLIRLLMSGSQKAAITLHHLMSLSNSSSSTTARAIMWYGAFGPLIEMCRQTGVDSEAQSAAAGMLNNICVMPDFRQELADDGIVRVMVGLLHRGDAVPESKEHAAECLEKFTSNTSDGSLRRAVVSQGGLRALLLYLRDNEEAAVNAIRNLVDVISTTSGSSADDDTATMKRLAGEQGCVPLLVRTIQEEGNSNSVREVAVEMLASLATYPPNAREMDVDDKCVPALVQLLDPGPHTNTANRHAVQCLLLLASTNKRCRNLMISHGANEHLRKLSDMNVAGATELLHRLEGGWLRSLFH